MFSQSKNNNTIIITTTNISQQRQQKMCVYVQKIPFSSLLHSSSLVLKSYVTVLLCMKIEFIK